MAFSKSNSELQTAADTRKNWMAHMFASSTQTNWQFQKQCTIFFYFYKRRFGDLIWHLTFIFSEFAMGIMRGKYKFKDLSEKGAQNV